IATSATRGGRPGDTAWKQIAAVAALGLTLVSFIVITDARPFPGWWAALPVAGTALAIASGPLTWANRAVFSQRWLVGIGLISYPLYLWHWPLLVFARIATPEPSFTLRLGIMLVAFLLSYATYR